MSKEQPIKVVPFWPGKIHNGLVNSQNCPEVKVKPINKMFACSCMALVWPGGSHNRPLPPSSSYYGCPWDNTNTTANNH